MAPPTSSRRVHRSVNRTRLPDPDGSGIRSHRRGHAEAEPGRGWRRAGAELPLGCRPPAGSGPAASIHAGSGWSRRQSWWSRWPPSSLPPPPQPRQPGSAASCPLTKPRGSGTHHEAQAALAGGRGRDHGAADCGMAPGQRGSGGQAATGSRLRHLAVALPVRPSYRQRELVCTARESNPTQGYPLRHGQVSLILP
jgi:hypothetical protein